MGRGDNRLTIKVRQRKAWRRKKARMNAKIEEGKAGKKAGGARRPAAREAATTTTTRRPAN